MSFLPDVPGLPDGEYNQWVPVYVENREESHWVKVTYKNGRAIGYRNPWDSSGAFIRFKPER
jgi:hypothetical protein